LKTTDGNKIALYSVPMLKKWVRANHEALDRIVNKQWIQMPLDRAGLWAAEELAVQKNVATEAVLTATPTGLYISRSDYPAFMKNYRSDLAALGGQEIAAAIGGFKTDLIGKLEGIRQADMAIAEAVSSNTDAVRSGLGDVNSAIEMSTLTSVLLHLRH
jgi:hypothetical protein